MNDLESRLQLQDVVSERDRLFQRCEQLQAEADRIGFPPGHYYSPIVDTADPRVIAATRNRLAALPPANVDLNVSAMKALISRLAIHHAHWPFPRDPLAQFRFYYGNPFFGCYDASIYFGFLLEFRPQRVVEVGSGYSSCLLLDTRDYFFRTEQLEVTLIDPALSEPDHIVRRRPSRGENLVASAVQDVALDTFAALRNNDILFIDSSHVCKTGSDVRYYLSEILPRLNPGVLVHIHDIFYPFEYPEEWVLGEKRNWNEAYVLHSFLQYNDSFEVVFWNNFFFHHEPQALGSAMPLCMDNEGGSLWLRKIK